MESHVRAKTISISENTLHILWQMFGSKVIGFDVLIYPSIPSSKTFLELFLK